MPDCPISSPPSLFGVVPPNQSFVYGSNYLGLLAGWPYWVGAAVWAIFVISISAGSILATWRRGPWPPPRTIHALLLVLGALGVLLPGLYLWLMGWPGTQMDTLWWFTSYGAVSSTGFKPACVQLLGSIDHSHTQMRDMLNQHLFWVGVVGGLFWFVVVIATLRAKGPGSSAPERI